MSSYQVVSCLCHARRNSPVSSIISVVAPVRDCRLEGKDQIDNVCDGAGKAKVLGPGVNTLLAYMQFIPSEVDDLSPMTHDVPVQSQAIADPNLYVVASP